MTDAYFRDGWRVFDPDTATLRWATAVAPVAAQLAETPNLKSKWLRHGGTWFAGVNVLENGAAGEVEGVSLAGTAKSWLDQTHGTLGLDQAQISVTYPGYPKQDLDEGDAAHRYRQNRDAAHVDGLYPIGPDRKRYVKEFHAYVWGVPLDGAGPEASPMVIWKGSHVIMAQAFRQELKTVPVEQWDQVDLTNAYHQARKTCFETCERMPVYVPLGGSYIVHRLALHGVAPWGDAAADQRMVAYFRPAFNDPADWLNAP